MGGEEKGKEKQRPTFLCFPARETSPGGRKVSDGEGEGMQAGAGSEVKGVGGGKERGTGPSFSG